MIEKNYLIQLWYLFPFTCLKQYYFYISSVKIHDCKPQMDTKHCLVFLWFDTSHSEVILLSLAFSEIYIDCLIFPFPTYRWLCVGRGHWEDMTTGWWKNWTWEIEGSWSPLLSSECMFCPLCIAPLGAILRTQPWESSVLLRPSGQCTCLNLIKASTSF